MRRVGEDASLGRRGAPVSPTPIAWLIASTTAATASPAVSRACRRGGRRPREADGRQAAQPATATRPPAGRAAREEEGSARHDEGYQQHRGRETTVPEGGPSHHRDERADRARRDDGAQPPVLLIDRARVGVGDDRQQQRGAEAPAGGGQRAQRRTDSEPRAGGGGLHERTVSGRRACAQRPKRSHDGPTALPVGRPNGQLARA